ncbi:hypothetical protein IB75_15525 [Nitrosococcus oceani C-27]|uniref:Uncharacterized protein n=1 Tax=Nitrosococcus oceani C-27 TaxID=314279 RepID=A0A0E2Z3G2_9GAMM|nr:hypothetical protein IB75_15525 [Nitrosococcus oceani C-27]
MEGNCTAPRHVVGNAADSPALTTRFGAQLENGKIFSMTAYPARPVGAGKIKPLPIKGAY